MFGRGSNLPGIHRIGCPQLMPTRLLRGFAPQCEKYGLNRGWHIVGAAGFDQNGVPDLVWQNDASRQVTVMYYGAANGATCQGWAWLNETGNPGWTVVGAADFDRNGVPDLIWQNDSTRQVIVNYYGGAGGCGVHWMGVPQRQWCSRMERQGCARSGPKRSPRPHLGE